MEWEDLDKKYAGVEIMNYVCSRETVAVFLLLGRNLQFPPSSARVYTHNWVIFEAGLAAAAGKPIWVFEDVNDNIKFPVPLVTDYAQYFLDDMSCLRYFGELFKQQFMYQYESPYQPRIETCPYETCNATYRFWTNSQEWHCPVCRRPIPRSAGSDREGFFPITVA